MSWRGLELGMHRDQLDAGRFRSPRQLLDWGEVLYQPDPGDAHALLGLSFSRDRLYRIVQDFSDDPFLPSYSLTPMAMSLYPKMQIYEYARGNFTHLVMIFKTDARVFKLDFLRQETGSTLFRAELVDVDEAERRLVPIIQ
jgi:hypothetical protein